jgi:hypothetical protein
MAIPDFTRSGLLPTGIHLTSGDEFIERFCAGVYRQKFVKPISDIFDFATDKGASHLFIGGSFVSSKENPRDLDCVMVFESDRLIPGKTEKVSVNELIFDILYASLESQNLIDSFLKLFTTGRNGIQNVGIIQVDLYDRKNIWHIKHDPTEEEFEIIKRAYNDRVIDVNSKNGLLISVHGLLSRSEWMKEIAPIASSQGWIYAPYVYEINDPGLLFSEKKRRYVVDGFREWAYDIMNRYSVPSVSVIAHSFGTYIVGAYLNGFDINEFPPVTFDSIILTGSILKSNFDWEKFRGISVGKVYNMIAPNDEYVKYMPETDLKKVLGMSATFGSAGLKGFSQQSNLIVQSTNSIFTHTNTIKRDIIETKWMPFINANKFSLAADFNRKMKEKFSK